MDRETLIHRNQQMAEAFHSQPMRHKLRRRIITGLAHFPFAPMPLPRLRRVLFIRPDHLGDMLLSTPAIRAFKQARPLTEIHVLASAGSATLLANYTEIDRVLTLSFPGFQRNAEKTSVIDPYRQAINVSRQLRLIGYHSAIIMRPDHWWGAFVAHAAGIPERVGYNHDDVLPFLTQPLPLRHDHVVRQNMRLVEHWTGVIEDEDIPFSLPVYEDDRDFIKDYLATYDLSPQKRFFCIHPGAGTWAKLWDNDQWAVVADTLIEQFGAVVIFTGSDTELPLIHHILNRMKHKALTSAGDLNIGQLAALYERALVVLGADSGPLHLAAAVDTPTVALFGPADPLEFGTWGDKMRHIILTSPIACRPCRVLDWGDDDPAYHPCVREISIAQVLEAARRAAQS